MTHTTLVLLAEAMDIMGEITGLSQQEEEEGRERDISVSKRS